MDDSAHSMREPAVCADQARPRGRQGSLGQLCVAPKPSNGPPTALRAPVMPVVYAIMLLCNK